MNSEKTTVWIIGIIFIPLAVYGIAASYFENTSGKVEQELFEKCSTVHKIQLKGYTFDCSLSSTQSKE